MVEIKRRVIQIANSTQLISLPRKWTQRYGIKKGDELEIEENNNKLTVKIEKEVELKSIEVDVTNLNRTMILYYMQNLYRMGYDEVKVIFNNSLTKHLRTDKEVNVISVLHKEVNRLLGFEIIQQRDNFALIKDISNSSIKEFDNVLRRVFLLLNDASTDLLKGVNELNTTLLETIEEKHDSITKFISYCLRLLNKYGYSDYKKTSVIYHILGTLDRAADVFKYAARDLLKFKHKLNIKTIQLFEMIDKQIKLFSEFFFKFDLKKIDELYNNRNKFLVLLNQQSSKIPYDELVLISRLGQAFELLLEMQVARMGMEY